MPARRISIPEGQIALVFDHEDAKDLNRCLLRIIRESGNGKPIQISREDRRTLVLFIASHDAEAFGQVREQNQ